MTAVNFTQNVNPGASGLTISSGASTTMTVIEDSTQKAFVSYGTIENVADITINGTGNTFVINHHANTVYGSTSNTGVNMSEFYRYWLVNTSNGGSDTDSGWTTFGSTALYNYDGGAATFINLNNAQTQNAVFVTGTATPVGTIDTLLFYNFGLSSIPSTATLIDLQVQVWAKATGGVGTPKIDVDLCWDGAAFSSTGGDDVAFGGWSNLTGTNAQYNHGGTGIHTNNWYRNDPSLNNDVGVPLTIADIRDSNFGVRIWPYNSNNAVYSIDYVAVKVWYTTKDVVQESVVRTYKMQDVTGSGDRILDRAPVQNTMVQTLEAGSTYHYYVDFIHVTNDAGGNWIRTSNYDRVTTIQEIKV